jgi:hypothetical protein
MTTVDMTISDSALDHRARRAAKRIGLVARKSRWRRDSIDNYGGFMLIDPYRNFAVCGQRYDLTADDVIEYCNGAADVV